MMRILLGTLLTALLTGCTISTQRHPGPMASAVPDLPPGTTDLYPAGPEEVIITRLADPVFVRRPGESSSFPLYYYRKQERMNAGSWVFAGAGGRVEVLYPGGTSVTLIGRGAGIIGSESRGEPLFFLRQCDRAVLHLSDQEQVRLLGGAVLTGDSGPIGLANLRGEILRVTNRSLATCWVAYREEVFQLDPAEVVELPLLDAGTGPLEEPTDFRSLRVGTAGPRLQVRGDVEVTQDGDSARVTAVGAHEVLAMGLRLRMDPGDEVVLSSLDDLPASAAPADDLPRADPTNAGDPGASAGLPE